MQLLSRLKYQLNKSQGFTLIEMLVVAPIAVITIATLISLMVALVGDVAVSRERSVSSYSVQSALDRIEQDARIATTYMPTFSIVTSPQGRDGGTAPFTTTSGDIIMSQYATTASPYDANREIVYYADQPNPCTGSYTLNRPLTVRVVYFTTGTAGNQTLWRRTIVPPNSTTASDTTKVCAQPWQRDNCPSPVTVSAVCQAADEKILTNVSSFTTTYYTSTGATTSDVRNADSLKVSLTQSVQVAGETVATSGVARGSHINVTTDNIPVAPTISVYNPSINTYNNPVLTTFAWDAIPNAAVYSVRYKINSGAWQVQPDQVSTQFQVTDARPRDTITIAVAAKNDMGNSTETSYAYPTPLWTVANLENDWDCYQPTETTYACPSYTLSKNGVVLIRGLTKGGATSTSVFTLPPGLRPYQQMIYPSEVTNYGFGRLDVLKDGRVYFYAGDATNYVSLDMLRFIAVGTPGVTWRTTGIPAGFTAYSSGTSNYGVPTVAQDASGRAFATGIVDNNTGSIATGATATTLPAGLGTTVNAIFSGVASPNTPTNYHTTNAPNIEYRGQGSTTSWNAWTFAYYPSSATQAFSNIALSTATGNVWTNYSTGYSSAQYTKSSDGIVTLRGLVKGGNAAVGAVIGTLPANYCPGKRYIFTTEGVTAAGGVAGQSDARIDIPEPSTTGGPCNILFYASGLSNTWISLDGIHFYSEQ